MHQTLSIFPLKVSLFEQTVIVLHGHCVLKQILSSYQQTATFCILVFTLFFSIVPECVFRLHVQSMTQRIQLLVCICVYFITLQTFSMGPFLNGVHIFIVITNHHLWRESPASTFKLALCQNYASECYSVNINALRKEFNAFYRTFFKNLNC